MNSDDHSSGFIDASSSLLSEHRPQRTVNFNLDPPSYNSVIADDSRHSPRDHGARSSLIESQNSPFTIGSESDHGFNGAVPYPPGLRSSMNSLSQPPYPTGPANIRDDGNAAPYPTAPTYTTLTNRPPYPTASSNVMLGFRTDETSRPSSRAMPEPVEMEDISIISASTPYPMDGPSGMPVPRAAPEFRAPIGFTNAVTVPNKSRSPTPKYSRPYESSTRSTESPMRSMARPIRSTPYAELPSQNVPVGYHMKQNHRPDMSKFNVIIGIFGALLFIAILAVVIKIIIVVRTA